MTSEERDALKKRTEAVMDKLEHLAAIAKQDPAQTHIIASLVEVMHEQAAITRRLLTRVSVS